MNLRPGGVESAGQAAFLATARCDRVQGYLYTRPLEVGTAEQFVLHARRTLRMAA